MMGDHAIVKVAAGGAITCAAASGGEADDGGTEQGGKNELLGNEFPELNYFRFHFFRLQKGYYEAMGCFPSGAGTFGL
jgi:hypothetical protein